jgi:hypothetical protein
MCSEIAAGIKSERICYPVKDKVNTRSHNDCLFTLVLKLLVILTGSLGGNRVKIIVVM